MNETSNVSNIKTEESTGLEIQYQMTVPTRCRREADAERGRERETGSGREHQMILWQTRRESFPFGPLDRMALLVAY